MRRLAPLLLLLAACAPELDTRLAVIDEPQIIAVLAEPAEAAPGATVDYRVIAVEPGGDADVDAARWAYCLAPKPPTEDNAVAAPCLRDDPPLFEPLDTGATVTATLPIDACQRFGPDTPPGDFRPRDPDGTGGYYQPVRVDAADSIAFGLHRLLCNLDGAPPEVAREFRDRYEPNLTPPAPTVDAPATAAPGEVVTLTASWPADAAEPYLWYDPVDRVLRDRREAIRVSWFTDAGALAVDATGVAEADAATTTSNTWTAPDAAGDAHLWIVLRDSRGGTAVTPITITVD